MQTKTIKYLWAIPCTKAIIDETTHTVSLIDIIEKLKIDFKKEGKRPHKVIISINFVLVSYWEIVKPTFKAYKIHLSLLDPKDNILSETTGSFRPVNGKKLHRIMTNIQGLPVTTPGQYKIKITLIEDKPVVVGEAKIFVEFE